MNVVIKIVDCNLLANSINTVKNKRINTNLLFERMTSLSSLLDDMSLGKSVKLLFLKYNTKFYPFYFL